MNERMWRLYGYLPLINVCCGKSIRIKLKSGGFICSSLPVIEYFIFCFNSYFALFSTVYSLSQLPRSLYIKDRNKVTMRKDPFFSTKNHSLGFNMQHSISVSRDLSMEWIRQMHQSRLGTMFSTSNRLSYLYMSMRSDLHTSEMTFWSKTVYCYILHICHQHDKSRFLFYKANTSVTTKLLFDRNFVYAWSFL